MAGNSSLVEFGSLVGGSWEVSGEWLVSTNPWTGEEQGRCSVATERELDHALDIAVRSWQSPLPLEERLMFVERIADLVAERQEELVGLLIAETGKPRLFALSEVQRLERTFRLASRVEGTLGEIGLDLSFDPRGLHFRGLWRRFPVGPVLAFVPYNWPFNLAAHKLAPALVAGCPVILKVSPLAPLCSFALASLLLEAGVPPGFLSVLHLPNDLAQVAVRDERVKMLSFTGSARVGWMLKELAPRKKVLLELGGNSPVIVEPDADLDLMAERVALSGYGYAGQVCISAQNVFVHEAVYGAAKHRLAEATERTVVGDPRREDVVCGPLIDEGAVRKVRGMVADALDLGARIVTQAPSEAHPRVVSPTLVENAPLTSDLVCEEVFGPVLTLSSYRSIDEVLEHLNRGRYRLHASIFTDSEKVARRVFFTLRYGGVIWNDSPSVRFDNMPYGGEGDSGFGREGVRFAIEEMTVPRVFLMRRD